MNVRSSRIDGAIAPLGLVRDERHRYRWNGGTWMPSVTTILQVKAKPALVGWAKRETAACAIRNLPMLARMAEAGGPDAAVDWLKRIPDYRRDAAADLGTRVHQAAEAEARGEPVLLDAAVRPFVDAYRRDFLAVFEPEFLGVETMVANLRHEYGGTADAWVVIDGEMWLLDLKTGSAVYSDVALQLAGLARAEFIGRPGDPVACPVPPASRFGVVHIRPEGARLIPVRVDRAAVAAFLDARRLFEWEAGPARDAIGVPLEPDVGHVSLDDAVALPAAVAAG